MSDIANGLKAIRLQWLDRLREFLDSEVVAKPGHPKRIGILGALGTGDVGDEAMLIALLGELRNLDSDFEFAVFSLNPGLTESYTGISCLPTAHEWNSRRKNPVAFLTSAAFWLENKISALVPVRFRRNEVDRGQWIARLVYLGLLKRARKLSVRFDGTGRPGGNSILHKHIQDVSSVDVLIYLGGGYINSWHVKAQSYLYPVSSAVAVELGIPVIGTGMNLGPFNTFDSNQISPILKQFALIGLRDEQQSIQALKKMGIYSETKHYFSSDDATNLRPKSDLELSKWADQASPYISLHVHYWRLSESDWLDFSRKIATVVDSIISKAEMNVVMLPMIFGPKAGAFDARALRDVADQCSHSDRILMAPQNLSSQYLRYLYGRASCALVCRHHSMVFSLAADVPTTALAYDDYYRQKLFGIASRCADDCEVLDALTSSVEQIEESILRHLQSQKAVTA
jgi:polysaccharide pyruvyl transferase WcaK-like protein